MPNGVSCAVNSCTFWDEGNRCNADSIQIQTDYAALIRQNSEFASELGYEIPEVRHSIDTCCQTYRVKDEDDE